MEPKKKKLYTLCLIHQGDKVLLGMKKIGFGAGQWNGFGGKVESGEEIDHAAQREVLEEVGLTVTDMNKVGVLNFEFESDQNKVMEVHVFKATQFTGEPIESNEMIPQWFDVAKVPYAKMWPDDQIWLPLLLADKKFTGTFLFDQPSSETYSAKILKSDLIEKISLN